MTPVSNNHDQQPKGNLEDLFRQKFAEAELTPRADVWERLDHELLVRENEGYRRRLIGYRRVAAAACGLITLGLGTWVVQQNMPFGAAEQVASVRSVTTRSASSTTDYLSADGAATLAQAGGAGQTASGPAARPADLQSVASGEAVIGTNKAALASTGAGRQQTADRATGGLLGVGRYAPASSAGRAFASIKRVFGAESQVNGGQATPLRNGLQGSNTGGGMLAQISTPASAEAATAWQAESLEPLATQLRSAGLQGLRPDSLKTALANSSALLAMQAPATEQAEDDETASSSSRWRWRGSYAAERFAPNVSSSSGGGIALQREMNSAITGFASALPATQLSAGLAHRAEAGVAVPLGKKHWTLLTGAELATIGGKTARETPQQYQNYMPAMVRDSQLKEQQGSYRMLTAGVPVRLRYEGRKQGWGVYAALGTAVNVLLRSSTTVGNETIRNDESYRRLLVSARGSAGVRYSPVGGQWHLALGPEAETGLNTLNVNPAGRWNERTRPYAVGLAASVEFGGGKSEVQP